MISNRACTENMELLAPAGSLQSFFAAIESGADGVFCGLQSFSARAKAKNFSLEDLERLVGYTHKLNKKIYVALNTLVKEKELPELIVILGALSSFSVDALIIQDLGLYELVHTHFPEIPIHASTQMVVHNLAGVKQLEKMGFERVVLARELSVKEIGFIGARCTIELEHFIHGALCYSISGHCFFSSYIDGRSGNRGQCIQPCRRRYMHNNKSGFYFSTSDFSALEHIPALSQAGVKSLKIEGRMKSAEYVASVVSAYRAVIDAEAGREQEAIATAREMLESAVGRKSSKGFLNGTGGSDIVLAKRKGGIGRIIGKVEHFQRGVVSFRVSDAIYVGDRLRIQPGNDRAGQGFTVRKILLGKRPVKRAGKNSFVSIPLPPVRGKIRTGDLVFKIATGKVFTMSKEACLRRLHGAPVQSSGILLRIECNVADSVLSVAANVAGIQLIKRYPVEMIPADKSPLSRKTLFKVFSHTGYPRLGLLDLLAEELPAVVIKPSRLKAIRRDFYAHLKGLVERELRGQVKQKVKEVNGAIVLPENVGGDQESRVYVVAAHLPGLQNTQQYTAMNFIVPITGDDVPAAGTRAAMSNCDRSRVVWDLPSINFDCDWSAVKSLVQQRVEDGFFKFRLNNISHFSFFNHPEDFQLIAGPWLYTLNGQSVTTLKRLGCRKFCLSIEDDRENMKLLLNSSHGEKILVPVYAPIELFTSRISSPDMEEESVLQDDGGEKFYLKHHDGLTVTCAEKSFSLLGNLKELRGMGGRNFILDLRHISLDSPAAREVMDAYFADEVLSGSVRLNFERGLI